MIGRTWWSGALLAVILHAQTTTRPAAIAPSDVAALRKTAVALLNDDRPSEALALLRSLREAAPKDPDVLAFIGEAHAMQENWSAAREAFDAAFAVDPALATRVVNRGMVSLKLRAIDAAAADFQVLADRGVGASLKARGHYGLGLVAEERGDARAARDAYERSLALDGSRTLPRYRLALLKLRAGEAAAAAALLEVVVAKDVLLEGAAYNLAIAYEKAGDAKKAADWRSRFRDFRELKTTIDACRQRLRTDPNQAAALLEMARAFSRIGAAPEALGGYRRYLAVAPFDRVARLEAATLYVGVGDAVNARKEIQRLRQGALGDAERAAVDALAARLPGTESR